MMAVVMTLLLGVAFAWPKLTAWLMRYAVVAEVRIAAAMADSTTTPSAK